MNNKERFLKYLQTCVKSTRATESNPLLLGGNAPRDYVRFLESKKLFDYNPRKWAHVGSMYDINDYEKALEVFNDLIADKDFLQRDKNDNQGWRRGAISHYICFLSAQDFFCKAKETQPIHSSKNILTLPLQRIFYGAPGTGKSNNIKREVEDKGRAHFRTTFHPDSDYSTFVGCYKPTMVEVPVRDGSGHEVANAKPEEKNRISYSFVPQAFTKAYCEAWNRLEANEPVFLIVEEINRGNCAQIFGDIFQLLDREMDGARCGFSTYPIDADEDLKAFLETGAKKDGTQWLTNKDGIKDGKLCLPSNLHIWATMNTSDQSLFPIDSAFKRRWDWVYVPIKRADKEPENKWIIKVTHGGKTYWCYWWEFLEAINHQIEETNHSEDKQLGYFFCKANESGVIDAKIFVNKVIFYLWNDVFKDEDSKVFQYGEKDDDVANITRSGNIYFRHFVDNTDEMVHYFINHLFAMGKDKNPAIPIDYLKNDNDEGTEHLPKMREDRDETPMPKIGNNKEEGDADGKNGRNTDKYIVDGTAEQIHKKQLLEKIVKKQIEQNPNITIEELKGCWDDISLNSQPCVLSEEEYQKLIKENPSYEGRYNQVNNGIWVNNQIGGEDTASKIIEMAKSLGVMVEIVKK